MNDAAIRKLRHRFILVSMAALVVSMLLIEGLIYVGTLCINRYVVFSTIDYILENNGDLITWDESEEDSDSDDEKISEQFMDYFFSTNYDVQSPEFQFSTRYFAVFLDDQGNTTEIRSSHIEALDEEEIAVYTEQAYSQRNYVRGRLDDYYYKIRKNADGSYLIVFLDGGSVVRSNGRLLNLALMLIGFGMLIAYFVVRALSSRAIQSEVKNAEIQKQFMTNVSHELKTPLAVIRANTEMSEMLEGETEWTQSTLRQVERMDGLIKNLVMISRADENANDMVNEDLDASHAVDQTIKNFEAMALKNGKTLESEIPEGIHMRGDEAQIRQLTSLLVDNAIKYCDDEGKIQVKLTAKGHGIVLTVSNDYAEGANVDYSRFFERFYRQDEAHNVDKGGYGIGLSIAESLVKQYKGSITADWKDGRIRFTCHLKSR